MQGKTAPPEPKGASFSNDGRQLAEDNSWFRKLDVLEAQPVKDIRPLQSQQMRHIKLSLSQVENMDDFDIMDAMERGEW